MIQTGRTLRLVLENLKRFFIAPKRFLHHLDRNLAPKLLVFRQKRRSHTSRTKMLQEQKMVESGRYRNGRSARRTSRLAECRHSANIDRRTAFRTFRRLDGNRLQVVLRRISGRYRFAHQLRKRTVRQITEHKEKKPKHFPGLDKNTPRKQHLTPVAGLLPFQGNASPNRDIICILSFFV